MNESIKLTESETRFFVDAEQSLIEIQKEVQAQLTGGLRLLVASKGLKGQYTLSQDRTELIKKVDDVKS